MKKTAHSFILCGQKGQFPRKTPLSMKKHPYFSYHAAKMSWRTKPEIRIREAPPSTDTCRRGGKQMREDFLPHSISMCSVNPSGAYRQQMRISGLQNQQHKTRSAARRQHLLFVKDYVDEIGIKISIWSGPDNSFLYSNFFPVKCGADTLGT